jgi:hypothetical protein
LTIRIARTAYDALQEHLFPGDRDEHGAVLSAGLVQTDRGTRLLVRDLYLARDGIDFVPGERGYRMLTAEFVGECAERCYDSRLCYLAVHNHGGRNEVEFSGDDMESHKRGYPALLQYVDMPVGALVFAENAVAGDIWLSKEDQRPVSSLTIVGRSVQTLFPSSPPLPDDLDQRRHRQSLLLGPLGQRLLHGLRVGVIGAGGVGSLVVEYLARLGVGSLLVVDPERIEETNFSRIVGSTELDWMKPLVRSPLPALRRIGKAVSTPKVEIARRVSKVANPEGRFEAVFGDARRPDVARKFVDCDFIFLVANKMQVRLIFNQIVHQYLIPGIQIGAKASINKTTGVIKDIFCVYRHVVPDSGCLWCRGLIPPGLLQEESIEKRDLMRQKYVDDPDIAAPSVITLNAAAAGPAVNQFLFSITGLRHQERGDYVMIHPISGDIEVETCEPVPNCVECGMDVGSRRARGDGPRLSTTS